MYMWRHTFSKSLKPRVVLTNESSNDYVYVRCPPHAREAEISRAGCFARWPRTSIQPWPHVSQRPGNRNSGGGVIGTTTSGITIAAQAAARILAQAPRLALPPRPRRQRAPPSRQTAAWFAQSTTPQPVSCSAAGQCGSTSNGTFPASSSQTSSEPRERHRFRTREV